jgi:hypothetical protein
MDKPSYDHAHAAAARKPETSLFGVKTPLITVAICENRSPALLERQLDALGDQSLDRAAVEIIIVNGSDQAATIRSLVEARPGLPVQLFDRAEGNPAILRNVALAEAVAPVILFLGPFDQPGTSLLAEHARSHQLFPELNVMVQGYSSLHPDLVCRPIAQFMMTTGRLGAGYAGAVSDRWLDGGWFAEGRCSCKCAFLKSGGAFDPALACGAEWIDLARRLAPQMPRILYNSRAISTITGPANFDEFCLESEQQGRADRVLIGRYPDAIVARKADLLRSTDRMDMLRARSEQLFAITQRLNDIAEARAAHEIEADPDFIALLHAHYADTLDAGWLRGVGDVEVAAYRLIA